MATARMGGGGSLIVGLAAGLIGGWLVSGSPKDNTVLAQRSTDAAAMLALTTEGVEGTQLLYLVDGNQRTLSIYQFDPRKGKLKLAAARHLAADEQLLEFNNEEPHVADIEKLVRSKNVTE